MANKPRPSVKNSKGSQRMEGNLPEADVLDASAQGYPQDDSLEDDPFDEEDVMTPSESDARTQNPRAAAAQRHYQAAQRRAMATASPGSQDSGEASNQSDARVEDPKERMAQEEASTRRISPYQPIESPRDHSKATKRNGGTNVDIPRAAPVRPVVPSYGAASVAASGPVRGMIPATGYKRKMSALNKVARVIGILFILALLAVVVLLGMLSVTEYRPADSEEVPISYRATGVVEEGQQISALTWNIGYCGLSSEADFFMDGGKGVRATSEDTVKANLESVQSTIAEQDTDIVFLQETDVNSDRSYHVDESQIIASTMADSGYCSSFAANYLVAFVPYPVPPIGQVYSGIQTATRFDTKTAQRIQLPCPFDWPARLGNLKRCLLVERVPIAETGKELVLVNLHLEAYDDGEGKAAQTAQLLRLIQREYEKGNYVIAGGDFNQVFSNVDISAYPTQGEGLWQCGLIEQSSFPEGWQLLMDPSVPTCRSLDRPYSAGDSTFQYYMIDGFICSPNVLVDELTTIDAGFTSSDHNPVRLVFTLSDEETVAAAIAEAAEAEESDEEQAEEGEEEESSEPEATEEEWVQDDTVYYDEGWVDPGYYTEQWY